MGLEKLVVSQIVKVAKDTGRLESTILKLEEKLKTEGLKVLEKTGINPQSLPFNPIDLINGRITNPNQYLTPQTICSLPQLSTSQKSNTITSVNNAKAAILSIISNKNTISSALITIQTPLEVLSVTGQTLDTLITAVKAAVKVIKSIPVPTAIIPPSGGIGVPINVLMILSSNLDQLDKLLTMGKGITSVIPPLISSVISMITSIINKLDALDKIILPVLTALSFSKVLAELGDTCPNLTSAEISAVTLGLSRDITLALAASGENSIPTINVANEEDLINSLSSNANPPLIYEGFILTLENNPDNNFDFASRRIKGERDFTVENIEYFLRSNKFTPLGQVTLFSDPLGQGRYSYSSSVQVLFEEMKYAINRYLLRIRGVAPLIIERENINSNNSNQNTTIPDVEGCMDSLATNYDPLATIDDGSCTYPLPLLSVQGDQIVYPIEIYGGEVQVTGTITINSEVDLSSSKVVVQLITAGGVNNFDLYTSSRLTFIKGVKPFPTLSSAAVAGGNEVITSPEVYLPETGIWNYTLTITDSHGLQPGNSASFTVILE
tara:strand:+ start:1325 stop:2983 length:1659 start_codon:yes stop_codon:yes gene_type:complete